MTSSVKLPGIGRFHTWQQLFLVEGVITMGLSVIAFFTLTDRPATARWLSEEEKALAIARVKSENVGTTEVLDGLDKVKIKRGILNPNTLTIAFIFLLDNITVQGLAFFLPTIVATIYPKASTIHKQLWTVPPYVVGAVFVLVIPYLSSRTRKYLIFYLMMAPLMSIGYIMFLATDASTGGTVRYAATFLIAAGAFPFGALCNAQASANTLSDTARSAGIGTVVMFGNVGGLISTWCFLPFDSPNYPIGNGLNLATSATISVLTVCLWIWLKRDNKRRDEVDVDATLSGLTEKQVHDLDWKHPAFRWKY